MSPLAPTASALLLILCLAGPSAGAAPGHAHAQAHQHGVLRLDVAVDGEELSLALQAPLDTLVGHERAPRTDAERRAAAEALSRLKDAAALFRPDAAAQCLPVNVDVSAGLLAPGAAAASGEHADLDASYVFRCRQPGQLRGLRLGLFDAFPRARRIEVQLAGPRGQRKLTLQRPTDRIDLGR